MFDCLQACDCVTFGPNDTRTCDTHLHNAFAVCVVSG